MEKKVQKKQEKNEGNLKKNSPDGRLPGNNSSSWLTSRYAQKYLDIAGAIIVIIDPNGEISLINQKGCKILGAKKEELIGKNWFDMFIPKRLNKKVKKVFNELMKNPDEKHQHYVNPIIDAAGKERLISWRNTILFDAEGNVAGSLSSGEDITNIKEAELASRIYAEKLEAMRRIDRVILEAETKEEMAQSSLLQVDQLLPYDRACIMLFDLKKNKAEVIASVAKKDMIPEDRISMNDLDFISDLSDGKPVLKKNIRNVSCVSPYFVKTYRQGIRSFVLSPLIYHGALLGALSLQSKTPSTFKVDNLGLLKDLTDHLAIAVKQSSLHETLEKNAVLLKTKVQQRTAQLKKRNTELEAFAASVSHDLRAPLRAIRIFCQLLSADCKKNLNEKGIRHLEGISRSAEYMDELIQDLMEYSRLALDQVKLTPLKPDKILDDVICQLKPDIEMKNAEIIIRKPLPEIYGQKTVLSQIFFNLIGNSLKFVEPSEKPLIKVWADDDNDSVRFWLQDNGIGIDNKYFHKIFNVFERLNPQSEYPGTGIGLALVKKGMDRLGGKVEVYSEVGKGTKFGLELKKPSAPL